MNFFLIGVLPVFLSVGIYALKYRLLEDLKMNCPSRDYCKVVELQENSFEDRSCECDSRCNDFRDCCIDRANYFSLMTIRKRKYTCMTFGEQKKVGVYIVDSCPQNHKGSEDLRNLCEKVDHFHNRLEAAPVTVVPSGKTYKNKYCAECNGAQPSSLQPWLGYLDCDTLDPRQTYKRFRINESSIWQKLESPINRWTWAVEIDDEYYRCKMAFDKPDNLTAVRLCRANTIDNCPLLYPRESVKRLCESYSAVVYDRGNAYKNPHCAICNNQRVNDLTCVEPEFSMRNAKLRSPFTLLLDKSGRNGTEVGKLPECPEGQRYDPFFKKCRLLVCALPGYKLVHGECRKE